MVPLPRYTPAMLASLVRRPRSAIRQFLRSEAASGVLLMLAALAAMIAANSTAAPRYVAVLEHVTGPVLSPRLGPMTVQL
jgi:NhaA family Na+:H+ antiporter